jgi:cyclopropane fatty-acyl-phospholipid synthase-like methyltransferase
MRTRRDFFLSILVFLVSGSAVAQSGHQPMHQRFQDAERWAKVFDDPARDEWQKPEEVIEALALAPDAKVADIGAGTGYFAVRLARAVPKGRVYGADLEPDMVGYLSERAEREQLPNLAAHRAAPDDPKLPEKIDVVLVVNTYHHIGSRERYFARLREALRPGGRVAIIDFRPDSPVGPPPRHRLAAEAVKREMATAGYRIAAEHDFLPYQYFVVFTPPS